jgi:hypothetical protein
LWRHFSILHGVVSDPREHTGGVSKGLRPPARTVKDSQDLDRVADDAVGHDVRRVRDYELARARNSTRSSHFGVIGEQRLNIADDMERNALGGCRIILLDIGPQRREIGNRLR